MNDDPAAVDESAAEATNVDDSESDMSETAGSEMGADDSEADDAMNGQSVDSLIEQIAAHDEELAAAAHELGDRIDTLETEVDNKDAELNELSEKLRRSRADFQNYKKRTEKNKKEMKARATEDLVVRLADVRENLVRALEQDEDADIRPGVESTLEAFDDALDAENVSIIKPEPGDDVDPEYHEVMLQVESDQPDGTIVDIYQNGYEMAGKVLQPAQVTVSSDDA